VICIDSLEVFCIALIIVWVVGYTALLAYLKYAYNKKVSKNSKKWNNIKSELINSGASDHAIRYAYYDFISRLPNEFPNGRGIPPI